MLAPTPPTHSLLTTSSQTVRNIGFTRGYESQARLFVPPLIRSFRGRPHTASTMTIVAHDKLVNIESNDRIGPFRF